MLYFVIFVIGVCDSVNVPPNALVNEAQLRPPKAQDRSIERAPKSEYDGWEKYSSREAKLDLFFPNTPIIEKPSDDNGNMNVAVIRPRADGLGFICQWEIRQEARRGKEAERDFLAGAQFAMVKGLNAKVLSGGEIVWDGATGREFIVQIDDKNYFWCRCFVADKRFINIMVFSKDAEFVRSGDAKKFFESLKIRK